MDLDLVMNSYLERDGVFNGTVIALLQTMAVKETFIELQRRSSSDIGTLSTVRRAISRIQQRFQSMKKNIARYHAQIETFLAEPFRETGIDFI